MRKTLCFLTIGLLIVMEGNLYAQTTSKPIDLSSFRNWAKTQGLSAGDLADLRITDSYDTKHNGVKHVYIQQYHAGIPIINSTAAIHIWKGSLVSKHQKLISGIDQQKFEKKPSLNVEGALRKVSERHEWKMPQRVEITPKKSLLNAGELMSLEISPEAIPYQLVYFADKKGQLHLAWNLHVSTPDHLHMYNVIVDAKDGNVLKEEDWVLRCFAGGAHTHDADEHMNLFEERAQFMPRAHTTAQTNFMVPQYNVLALPTESPNHGNFSVVVDPSDSVASPFGWHDSDGINGPEYLTTRGNNVYAYEDTSGNDVPGYSPATGLDLDFNFPYDPAKEPVENLDPIITNLFYISNVMHDVWYNYGFDEAAGNFQENNYGNGGTAGDPVLAEAQEGSMTNNAAFTPSADGEDSRLLMFIWEGEKFSITAPADISGDYKSASSVFGVSPDGSLTGEFVLVEDGSGNNEGCDTYTNAAAVAGKIAVIDRGTCGFVEKVQNAEAAGAIAAIVINNEPGDPIPMSSGNIFGGDEGIGIPSIMISQADGTLIKNKMASETVSGTMEKDQNLDSSLDNGVAAHEYGHGISTRIAGGPGNSGCVSNQEGAGEGWSDFFALAILAKPGDKGTDAKGVGTYLLRQPTDGVGIREFPYSTDMSINPHTYGDVEDQVVVQDFFGIPLELPLVHGIGSIMCAMLWDMYWALVDEYGFDPDIYRGKGGNNIAMQLVIDGLKLQPCGAGFVDIRDAILMADSINNGGVNQGLIWRVFARRGLGFSARQGSAEDISDNVEAFDIPDRFKEYLFTKTVDNLSPESRDTVTFTFFVKNQKGEAVENMTLVDTLDGSFVYVDGSSSLPVTQNGNILTFELGTIADGDSLDITFQAIANPRGPFSEFFLQDDLEGDTSAYTAISQVGSDGWVITDKLSNSPTRSWFVPNVPTDNDQSLELPAFTPNPNTVLSFWHYFNTEIEWDGGVVEILVNNQWQDLDGHFISNGYTSIVQDNNPISPTGERPVFGGDSEGWIQSKIALGDFAGEEVRIRFRFGSDEAVNEEGWYIDDIQIGDFLVRTNTGSLQSNALEVAYTELENSMDITITNYPLSITDLPAQVDIKVYPNPAEESLNFEYTGSKPELLKVSFRNNLGQLVKAFELRPVGGSSSQRVDISTLPAGIYHISIVQGSDRSQKKILVK